MRQYEDELEREIARDLGWDNGTRTVRVQTQRSAMAWSKPFRFVGRFLWRIVRGVWRLFTFPVIRPARLVRMKPDGSGPVFSARLWDGLLTRLLLTPAFLAAFFIGLVWLTTHPRPVVAAHSPAESGLVYRHVSFTSVDGQVLAGWYLPPMTVDDVVTHGESILTRQWPGVVLCHGLGFSHDQYLPLAQQLHNAGFAVLMVDLRGQGSSGPGTITFGLRERFDILAAVNYLRGLPAVDGGRISVVGHGMAAAATLHAASLDPAINAIVADDVWPSLDDRLTEIFHQPGVPTGVMRTIYTMTFDVMLREHASQLDLHPVVARLDHQAALFVVRQRSAQPTAPAVLALAADMPGAHRVLVEDRQATEEQVDRAVCEFLQAVSAARAPQQVTSPELRQFLDAQIHK